jgi:hypothetical protein
MYTSQNPFSHLDHEIFFPIMHQGILESCHYHN